MATRAGGALPTTGLTVNWLIYLFGFLALMAIYNWITSDARQCVCSSSDGNPRSKAVDDNEDEIVTVHNIDTYLSNDLDG